MNDFDKIAAENIRRRRLLRGLDQAQAAQLVGISRVAYGKIEAGKTMPRDTTLEKLLSALNIAPLDLFKETLHPQKINFRTKKLNTQREQVEQEATIDAALRKLKDYSFLEELGGKTNNRNDGFLKEMSIRAKEDISSFAGRVRVSLSQFGWPIPDSLDAALEQAGIKLLFFKFAIRKVFGFSFGNEDGGPAIVVNDDEDIPAERKLFTIAHELGHLLLHGCAYGSKIAPEIESLEREADSFAADFLVPREEFKRAWENAAGLGWFDRVITVKRLFRVSYATVLRRLGEMEKTPKEAEKKINLYHIWFCQNFQRHFGCPLTRQKEPCSVSLRLEGRRFPGLARQAFLNGELSESRLRELLGLGVERTRELVNDWSSEK